MTNIRSTPMKKEKSGFIRAIASEKHERTARRSLHDIVAFYQLVEKEIRRLNADKIKGRTFDGDMYKRLALVQGQYKHVMKGFLELDDNRQRHALVTFADTIQDLMKYIHSRKVTQ